MLPSFLDLDLRSPSCSLENFNMVVVLDSRFFDEFRVGGGWYSTCSKEDVGGSLARRSVRSMNGGTATERPRAMSDHVLMKWMDERPSDNVWNTPPPRATPPHLKRVIYKYFLHYQYIK